MVSRGREIPYSSIPFYFYPFVLWDCEIVGRVGLEPTSLAALAPKASAFAISPPARYTTRLANFLPAGRQAPPRLLLCLFYTL